MTETKEDLEARLKDIREKQKALTNDEDLVLKKIFVLTRSPPEGKPRTNNEERQLQEEEERLMWR